MYNILEILWRGYTHISMTFLGGVCFLFIYLIQKHMHKNILLKALVCTIFITFAEFVTGIFVNIIFHQNVWNYSNLKFNIMGQISALYSLFWYILSFPILLLSKKIELFLEG